MKYERGTDFYYPEDQYGIAWNDPRININWPYVKGEFKGSPSPDGYAFKDDFPLILSEKDKNNVFLKER